MYGESRYICGAFGVGCAPAVASKLRLGRAPEAGLALSYITCYWAVAQYLIGIIEALCSFLQAENVGNFQAICKETPENPTLRRNFEGNMMRHNSFTR